MGAGSQTGMPTVEQLEAALKQASTLTGCQDKDNVYRVLAEHVQTVVDNTVKKAIDSAAAATSSFMAAELQPQLNQIVDNIKDCSAAATNLVTAPAATGISAERNRAITKFNASIALVNGTGRRH